MCSYSINNRGWRRAKDSAHNPTNPAGWSLKLPLLLLNGLNAEVYVHTHGDTHMDAQNSKQADAPISTHQAFLHRRRVILGQEQSLGEPPSQERRRRKKTHWCIYRKMRPHNILFGERIIKEPRCAGACVPVFWLTLCKQAGPRMNQGWDEGLTPWHTHRETALAFHAHSPLAHEETAVVSEWRNGAMFWVRHPFCLTLGCGVVGGGSCFFFFCSYYIWEDRLDNSLLAGRLQFDIQDEEVFAKQKRQILFSTEQTGLSVSI